MNIRANDSSGAAQRQIRLDKRDALGSSAYPPASVEVDAISKVRSSFQHVVGGVDARTGVTVSVAGRLMNVRNSGKLCFAVLQAGDGARIQLMLSVAEAGLESVQDWKRTVDLGDHVQAIGQVISSTRGELSILATEWSMLSKSLRPLPNAYTELSEETAIRQPYLDLIFSEESRRVARLRSRTLLHMRSILDEGGFFEVETPMLQSSPGGANARPFTTRSNAYGTDLYLRIAVELYLKRAVIGGFDRVFEIGRNFRNEGADRTHSPEFTMLEAYQAYSDYESMKELTVNLIQGVVQRSTGSLQVTHEDGSVLDFSNFDSVDLYGSLSAALGASVTPDTPREVLAEHAVAAGLEIASGALDGKVVEELWEHYVKPTLTNPTFVMDFPADTSPLTAPHRSRPGVAEKWDLYIAGAEIATGYSELIDPVIQRQKLEAQVAAGTAGDAEAMRLDEDFLTALEYGMPPTGGIGIGIDRLLMTLTGGSIRDIQLFPFVR